MEGHQVPAPWPHWAVPAAECHFLEPLTSGKALPRASWPPLCPPAGWSWEIHFQGPELLIKIRIGLWGRCWSGVPGLLRGWVMRWAWARGPWPTGPRAHLAPALLGLAENNLCAEGFLLQGLHLGCPPLSRLLGLQGQGPPCHRQLWALPTEPLLMALCSAQGSCFPGAEGTRGLAVWLGPGWRRVPPLLTAHCQEPPGPRPAQSPKLPAASVPCSAAAFQLLLLHLPQVVSTHQ